MCDCPERATRTACERKRVAVIATGGTIQSLGRDRLDIAWYSEHATRVGGADLLARVPELAAIARVRNVPFRLLSSQALTPFDWLELARLVERVLGDEGEDAVVVLHGTNTLEETAYFLHLVLQTTKPLVITGAMRPLSAASSDAELNLINAVAAAAAPDAARKGVLVVLNDAIYSARDVTKTSTYRLQSFAGRELGPLGIVDADRRVLFHHAPARLHTSATEFSVDELADLPRVDVAMSYVGADGAMIDAAAAAGARGIVSAATGAGRPTPLEDAALDRVREQGLAVCIASRVGSGRVVRSPALAARGFVAADNLPPWKARILLSLALTRTNDPDEIQRLFDTY